MPQNLIDRTIDEEFFAPLRDFFASYNPDLGALEELILEKGYPKFDPEIDNDMVPEQFYAGFILEVYVKQALDEFAKVNPHFSPSQFTSGKFGKEKRFDRNIWGNFKFYDQDAKDDEFFSEIDAIYEWVKIPVIFEISYTKGKYKGTKTPSNKRGIVWRLYESTPFFVPYFINVRPVRGNEEVKISGTRYYKSLIIPRPDLGGIAHRLTLLDSQIEEEASKPLYSRLFAGLRELVGKLPSYK